jgi:uncharacterized iron-regulated membrane protein
MGGGVMRKTIFWLHLVTGLVAGVVILIMSVTGVLLMYQKQITAWADGARIEAPAADSARLPVETLLAKIRETETNAPASITISSNPRTAASFSFGREKTVFVDPYSGRIIGEGSKGVRAFFQSMIDWHRWLAMAGEQRAIGKAITGACNLGFLFLVVSGLYLWWPRKWTSSVVRAITRFDFSLSGKARDWNWHNVAGFWSAIPLFLVVFTATFFSYPWATDLLYRVTGDEPPPKPSAPASAAASGPGSGSGGTSGSGRRGEGGARRSNYDGSGLNTHWAAAESKMPGWKTISLRLPASNTAPLTFTIDKGNGARPDLRAQLTIDPKGGEAEKWETYSTYNSARQIRLWVRWIHTGEAGGFLGQTIAGVASAAGALLVWTGVALAFRRFFKRKGVVV